MKDLISCDGGTQPLDQKKWNNKKILHDIVDSFVMLILVAEKSEFGYSDFIEELESLKKEVKG